MKKMTSQEVRQMFLDFFKSKGHVIEPSVSLVPVNDPTLLWINSGVATLKKYFDGSVIPENPRITNAQKAIRTNDIENVGKTARHHTMFEMLGNFSIGDYFRKEAIMERKMTRKPIVTAMPIMAVMNACNAGRLLEVIRD